MISTVKPILVLASSGTAKLTKAVTQGAHKFNKGTYTVSIEITACVDSVTKGIPTLSNIAGTFTIDGVNNSQDVTNQPFTMKSLKVDNGPKSLCVGFSIFVRPVFRM